MIYGAYGYTGRLVAELAVAYGERPVLAGRDPVRLDRLARQLDLEHMAFALSDVAAVARALEGIDVVAHCAGPFSATAAPMVTACLDSGTHYLDITGEIDVLEAVLARDADAKAAGVVLLPGAGFDVVPSDCLAAQVAARLPTATLLELAFRIDGLPSAGTAKSAVEALGRTARCRVGGRIVDTPPPQRRRRTVRFADGECAVTAVSWGDVATAFHSTGIPDVSTYTVLPAAVGVLAALAARSGGAVRHPLVQRVLTAAASRLPGPSPEARRRQGAALWCRASDDAGNEVTGIATTPNAYSLTAQSVVRIAAALAAGGVGPGALTPSRALGAGFAAELDGVRITVPA